MLILNAAGFLDKPSVTLRVPSDKSARTSRNECPNEDEGTSKSARTNEPIRPNSYAYLGAE